MYIEIDVLPFNEPREFCEWIEFTSRLGGRRREKEREGERVKKETRFATSHACLAFLAFLSVSSVPREQTHTHTLPIQTVKWRCSKLLNNNKSRIPQMNTNLLRNNNKKNFWLLHNFCFFCLFGLITVYSCSYHSFRDSYNIRTQLECYISECLGEFSLHFFATCLLFFSMPIHPLRSNFTTIDNACGFLWISTTDLAIRFVCTGKKMLNEFKIRNNYI